MGQNCAAQAARGPQPKSCGAVVRVTRNGYPNCVQAHRIAERLRNECAPRGFACQAHTRRVDSPPRRSGQLRGKLMQIDKSTAIARAQALTVVAARAYAEDGKRIDDVHMHHMLTQIAELLDVAQED